jgi:predicted transcriptional regulator
MTVGRDHGGVSRRKTTVYLDADVLTATKMLAAARERSESQVVEDALRAYLRAGRLEAAGADLKALMDRLAERADLDDKEAMALAVEEVRTVRAARHSKS